MTDQSTITTEFTGLTDREVIEVVERALGATLPDDEHRIELAYAVVKNQLEPLEPRTARVNKLREELDA